MFALPCPIIKSEVAVKASGIATDSMVTQIWKYFCFSFSRVCERKLWQAREVLLFYYIHSTLEFSLGGNKHGIFELAVNFSNNAKNTLS